MSSSRMDEDTDKILERLEDPRRPGPWDRRGMVVGDVQSGKTSNYSGLICKAADAGYSAIIILAGMHNNLRSQTQERIDTGLLGFDTEKNMSYDNAARWVGVGLLNQSEFRNLPIMALTTSKAQGDFKRAIAESLGITALGGTPVVFVVKKNKSVLENLCQWLNDRAGEAAALIIDDEADNASVNTGGAARAGRGSAGTRSDHDQPAHPHAAPEVQEAGLCRLHGHAVRQHLHPLAGRSTRPTGPTSSRAPSS